MGYQFYGNWLCAWRRRWDCDNSGGIFSGSDYNMDAEKNGGTNCIDDRA